MRNWLSRLFASAAPVAPIAPATREEPRPWRFGAALRAWARRKRVVEPQAFSVYEPAPGVLPTGTKAATMAMDAGGLSPVYDYAAQFGIYTRSAFRGYAFLAQLAQHSEYRRPVELIAKHMTRKWLTLTSTSEDDNTEKLKRLGAALTKLRVQDLFRRVAEQDGFFGRSQIYIDTGCTSDSSELLSPLFADKRKIKKGGLKGLTVIEPFWTYPNQYNSTDPLQSDFFKPQQWFVMGREIHHSRLLTFVSREVPDILKPMYAFGGLSLTQMLITDVEIWGRTQQGVADITLNFSVSGVKTNMATLLQGGVGATLQDRAEFISDVKDNQGLLLLDKDSEEYFNTAAPLGTLDKLQAQAQEHMAATAGIPLIIRFGITPSGLNATSDGELQVYADWIHAQQENLFTPHMTTILDIVQLSEFGEIDPDIGFRWESLEKSDLLAAANVQKVQADTDAEYVAMGALGPKEVRQTLAADEDGRYSAIDLAGDGPEADEDEATEPDMPSGGEGDA